ncbi:MAG: aminomethyltransferase family protein [Chloroflexota bacterium]
MAIGSPFDARAQQLNVKRQWRVWAGRFSSSAYTPGLEIEYNAIRHAAALIDISPLHSYRVSGPDAARLVDRVITRDATRIAPGQVIYTPWCDEGGAVVDDGTVAHLDDGSFRWTAADPQLRWLRLHARRLDVTIQETSETLAALAVQGPLSRAVLEAASGTDLAGLRPFRRRAMEIAGVQVDVSRTGYTGDLGYELWVDAASALPLWDALMASGAAYALRPAGIWALDVARLEAGLIMLDVDYTAATHAATRDQRWSPYELGLGRFVELDKPVAFTGRSALLRERDAGGPPRRLVGLVLDEDDLGASAAA